MKFPDLSPGWLVNAVGEICSDDIYAKRRPLAEKLAGESALLPLWRKIEKRFTGDEFWQRPENFFKHLVTAVAINLEPLTGYHAMSPAKLDEWRERTQRHALALLEDLMDGYPDISEKHDEAFICDPWTVGAALHAATKGQCDSIKDLGPLIEAGKLQSDRFAKGLMVAAHPQVFLTCLISWLDFDAAKDHSVTHAVAQNAHRNSFIRRTTRFFEENLNATMRAHVFNISALFFDMGALEVGDIKKIAPSGRGKLPKKILQNLPEDGIL